MSQQSNHDPERPDELDEEYVRWIEEIAADQREDDCFGCGQCEWCIERSIAAAENPQAPF